MVTYMHGMWYVAHLGLDIQPHLSSDCFFPEMRLFFLVLNLVQEWGEELVVVNKIM